MTVQLLHIDVTAVKLHEGFVIAGHGSNIEFYNKNKKHLLTKTVLQCQKIHGIEIDKNKKCIIYGGKQFCIAQLSYTDCESVTVQIICDLVITDDWIIDAKWMASERYVLLNAHNTVEIRELGCSKKDLYQSNSNSILYSGLIQILNNKEALVLAGTVFTDILIVSVQKDEVIHTLKGHKGVIFSIALCVNKKIIVSTSDDRSVIIWKIQPQGEFFENNLDSWKNCDIESCNILYGHSARVLRCCLSKSNIVSAGEDSCIIFWGYDGKLLRKSRVNLNACVWSVHSDDEHVISGSNDGAVVLHPQYTDVTFQQDELFAVSEEYGNIKAIAFTARQCIVAITEKNYLLYFTNEGNNLVIPLGHKTSYKMMDLSSCKQLVATCDMDGCLDIFAENCKSVPYLIQLKNTQLDFGKILSLHWSENRHIVICNHDGDIAVLGQDQQSYSTLYRFKLPICKERYLTAIVSNLELSIFVMGDRSGNIHFYRNTHKEPVKTFKKVHNNYGPNCLSMKSNLVESVGRDGKIFYFKIDELMNVKKTHCTEVPILWAEKFLDKDKTLLCGFREKYFVVYDMRKSKIVFEVLCGGGHRAWDVCKYVQLDSSNCSQIIALVFMKNGRCHRTKVNLSTIESQNVIDPVHTKEINTLKLFRFCGKEYIFSGSEDTTIQISEYNSNCIENALTFRHLSSVRTIELFEDNRTSENTRIFTFSGGGRAQICIKMIEFNVNNDKLELYPEELICYQVKGTDNERNAKAGWRNRCIDFDPETRIMDIAVTKLDSPLGATEFLILTGCSDSILRLYKFTYSVKEHSMNWLQDISFHKTCVLKVHFMEIKGNLIGLSMTTTGDVSFWNMNNSIPFENVVPFLSIRPHKSGINCFDVTEVETDCILLATGSDDNAIVMKLICLNLDELTGTVKHEWVCSKWHCSQITAVQFYQNFVITASIDQRITIARWNIAHGEINCNYLNQYFTDVADVQGLCLRDNNGNDITLWVYGKGLELLSLNIMPYLSKPS